MSGKIEVEIDKIIWKDNLEKVVEIHFDEILIIGEYTIDSMFDDWFMVFVEKNGSWKRISMFAENTSELLNVFAEKFNLEVGQTQLANSAKWNSVISYPKLLRGKKLLKLVGGKIELEKDVEEYIAAYR
jgi:hypothetical protein